MKLRVHPAFLVYVILIGLIDGVEISISLLFTLLIHEIGHLAVGTLCAERYDRITLTPLGGMISYKSGSISHKGLKGMMIAAAGPAANVAAIMLLIHSAAAKEILVRFNMSESLIMMNFSMAAMNLMPALPLDGGRIVFSIGYYVFPTSVLTAVLTALGHLWGGFCISLSVFAAIKWGRINVSLLAAGFYIVICAGRQREMIYAVNLHTVIQERLDRSVQPSACEVISVEHDMRISCTIPHLCKSDHLICSIETEQGIKLIDERYLLDKLLSSPVLTFDQAFPELLRS